MNNFIISIGRQVGAGGYDTARALANVLGVKVYDKELLAETARRSGLSPDCFEKSDEQQSRRGFHSFFGIRGSSHLNESLISHDIMSDDSLFRFQSDTIRQIAEEESCIIIGRCADYVLRDNPGLVSVFISADLPSRIRRIMEGRGLSEPEAKKFVEQNERARADYYNYFTFKKWGDSSSYDLCIDSSKLGDDVSKVVSIILNYMEARGFDYYKK